MATQAANLAACGPNDSEGGHKLKTSLRAQSRLRIVLGDNTLADYLQAGGHWSVYLSYLLGLQAAGHDVVLLELVQSSGDRSSDNRRVASFFAALRAYGVQGPCCALVHKGRREDVEFQTVEVYGLSRQELYETVKHADLLWNVCGALPPSLVYWFHHRVFVDLDPGHLQVSALEWDLGFREHDAFLTVGRNMGHPACEVPTLGLWWHPFLPFTHLPLWGAAPDPGPDAPFTSVTHWTWAQLLFNGRTLSISKRDAYLQHVDLPLRAGRTFELAVGLDPNDPTMDRQLLTSSGWAVVDPWDVAGSVSSFGDYLRSSRAEICCPKPIFVELKTGWFSDRSVCYLANGRPVLVKDTGFSSYVPTGAGVLAFNTTEEAVDAVAEIDGNYQRHRQAARALAEEYFDASRTLPEMIEASWETGGAAYRSSRADLSPHPSQHDRGQDGRCHGTDA